MKYLITFLGMGKEKGTQIGYQTTDNKNTISGFVQAEIIHREYVSAQKHFDKIIVICTSKTKETNAENLKLALSNDIECCEKIIPDSVEFIVMQDNYDIEEVIKDVFDKNIQDNSEITVDITHAYRMMPMKIMFFIDYILKRKQLSLKHLYYGRLEEENENSELLDIKYAINQRYLVSILKQFERRLMINIKDISELVDNEYVNYIRTLQQFNDCLEICDFENILDKIKNILSIPNNLKNSEQPITKVLNKIVQEFRCVNSAGSILEQYIKLIELIINKGRLQVAITLTDYLLKAQLIRVIDNQNQLEYDYGKSKELFDMYFKDINNTNRQYDYCFKELITNYKEDINYFITKIRNKTSHGSTISDKKEEIVTYIKKVIELIKEMEGFRGGTR